MNIAVITSVKAPYRTLQLEEICMNKDINMTVYYTQRGKEDRDWETKESKLFKEIYLDNIKIMKKFGVLNTGLRNIIRYNDFIVLGGYEKPTYILLSLLCRLYKKKYVIIYDGISCNRLYEKEKRIKWIIKNIVIKHSSAIWGNGTVSKRYFNEVFNYPIDKIYNQYLTIDGKRITEIGKNKIQIRDQLRERYGIGTNERVLHYSGRLVEVKNVQAIIKALSKINNTKITLFITGDGILRKELEELADKLNIKIIITGFINNQEELFKHYYLSDAFILPSKCEAWGLVVNEAMYAGLPVLISDRCGCSMDLVENGKNGFKINGDDIEDIAKKINMIMSSKNLIEMSEVSKEIIREYSFDNSAKSFIKMIKDIIR